MIDMAIDRAYGYSTDQAVQLTVTHLDHFAEVSVRTAPWYQSSGPVGSGDPPEIVTGAEMAQVFHQ